MEGEHPNLRAALDWLTERGDIEAALRLAAACSWFWWYRGHFAEGRAKLEALLARTDATAHERAWAAAMSGLGLLTHAQGDYARAVQLHEAAEAAWRRLADPDRLADALFQQGLARMFAGDDQAIPVLSESVSISRTLSDPRWLGGALWGLGRALHHHGEAARAVEVLEESLARARESENPMGIAVSLSGLGEVTWVQGDKGRGLTMLREALVLFRDLGEAWATLLCLEWLAAAFARDRPQSAARLFAAAGVWREAVGLPRSPAEEDRFDREVAAVRDALGEEDFATRWAAGRLLKPEQAVAAALADVGAD